MGVVVCWKKEKEAGARAFSPDTFVSFDFEVGSRGKPRSTFFLSLLCLCRAAGSSLLFEMRLDGKVFLIHFYLASILDLVRSESRRRSTSQHSSSSSSKLASLLRQTGHVGFGDDVDCRPKEFD